MTDPHIALQALRARAERRYLVSAALPADTTPEVQRLVEELQVHQIELEMQYEELLRAQAEAEASRAEYVDLYDFAPVGYCTVTANGTLLQLNLRASQLLGQTRQQLLGRRLALSVIPTDRDELGRFLARLWAMPGQRQRCELTLRRPDDSLFHAQLKGETGAPPAGLAPLGPGPPVPPPDSCRLVLLDVNEQRRATEALAASEARFRASFEQSRDGMLLLEGARLTALNAAALRLMGLTQTPAAALGRELTDFWPERQPDGRRTADQLARGLHLAQTAGWCRLEWRRPDPATGEDRWDELSFNPVLVQGQPLLNGTWRDITARRQAEQALRESEARQQLALAAASAGVWSWDRTRDEVYLDVNTQLIFGLASDRDRVLSRTELLTLLHPADWPGIEEDLGRAWRERTTFDYEHRLVLPGGELRHVAIMGRFAYDETSGEARGLTALVRDITARRRADEQLNYQNRLLDNILQNLPVALMRIDAAGRYREAVGAGLRRIGLADNQLLNEQVVEHFPNQAARLARLLAGESDSYVMSLEHQGQPVHYLSHGFWDVAHQEGVLFAIDITDSERLKHEATRRELRQQQEVLSAILSTQEEERRRIAEALHNGVGQLLYATRLHLDMLPATEPVRASQQLLNEAIEATRGISFELTPTILEDFGLTVALRELVGRLPAGSLAVDLNLRGLEQPLLPPLLATAVYRIVQELLNNVMKHARAREVFVQVSREDNQLHLSVEDDGVGFDAASPGPREGIGLASIRTRVGLLGGTVEVRSRPGRGTGFFLQLPVPGPA